MVVKAEQEEPLSHAYADNSSYLNSGMGEVLTCQAKRSKVSSDPGSLNAPLVTIFRDAFTGDGLLGVAE